MTNQSRCLQRSGDPNLFEEYRGEGERNEGKGRYDQTREGIWVLGPEVLREVIWPAILWSR
jgi:hypothetical protein